MLHYFKKVCVLALLPLSCLSVLGQLIGDCSTENWEEVVGVVHYSSEGVCEYEVDDWSSPNFLELDIAPLIQSSSQIHHFQFYCDMSGLDLYSDARFRPFEIISANNKRFLSIDLAWNPSRLATDPALVVYGECIKAGVGITPKPAIIELGQMRLPDGYEGLLIQISWKPNSSPGVNDGWLEFYVNGVLAGREEGPYSPSNPWRPKLVRFGSTNTPQKPPVGIFRIRPGNPAPYAFHL